MVKEEICLELLRYVHSHGSTRVEGTYEDLKISENELFLNLLPKFGLDQLENATRWLQCGEFLRRKESGGRIPNNQGIAPEILRYFTYHMMHKGKRVIEQGGFSPEDRQLLYQDEQPYSVFIAHQFNPNDQELVDYINIKVLKPLCLTLVSGKADGLGEFRQAILSKIRASRFFLCLLTKRVELPSGGFTSSTWLYQETGAAIAFGKKPLLLVEEGIDSHYVGEFQKVYEHLEFTRSNHPRVFEAVGRKFVADLEANYIPLPKPLRKFRRS